MADISPKPVKITETILRDAHQSLIATRMPTSMMLPIVDKMDFMTSSGAKTRYFNVDILFSFYNQLFD